jgi:NTE family protein
LARELVLKRLGELRDRLCAAAGTIIMASPEFQRLVKDVGAKLVAEPPAVGTPATAH